MTGFGASTGAYKTWSWSAELRSVNGKGLDLRVRAPEWIAGLEPAVRAAISAQVKRGSLTFNLRLTSEQGEGVMRLAEPQLRAVLGALGRIEAQAMELGLALAPSTATQIAALRGVFETAGPEQDAEGLLAALLADLETVLEAFLAMRRTEGAALEKLLSAQLALIETLVGQAESAAAGRQDRIAATLKRNLTKVLDAVEADPQRLAQELALIAVKSDVTEELDRLRAHIAAARDLLAKGGPVGRKLDFLMQEFNREANTLCAKSQDTALTKVGLDLKVHIDQMREQVQNVE